ncbi:MAG TPA: hypothetical protein VF075_11460, partial [Pyrinomonadaceae bacterium]
MSPKWNTLILSGASLTLACAATAILISRASTQLTAGQGPVQTQTAPSSRNLSLQPEAVRVNRRLGNRFKSS